MITMQNKFKNLVHNRYGRLLVFSIVIILSAAISYTITSFFLQQNSKKANTAESTATSTEVPELGTTNVANEQNTKPQSPTSPSQSSPQSPATPQQTVPNSQASSTIYCGVKGMPEGVCVAIGSIEKNGLKNNPYVSYDTTSVPDNTQVSIDRLSWQQNADVTSSVKFTASVGNVNYKGSATFSEVNGTWKVIAFSIAN